MEHLVERRMIEALWDGAALDTVERGHLSLCVECQQQFATLALLRDEFEVARLSRVGPEAENRLVAIFEQIREIDSLENPLHHLFGTLSGLVRALPLWDSRQQAGMAGIRNASRSSYRLLFGAKETEIELLVESQNGMLRVTGEVMVPENSAEGSNGLALVELMASADAKTAIEAESDVNGRFALERVPPGIYTMTITPRYSQMVVIEPLELT